MKRRNAICGSVMLLLALVPLMRPPIHVHDGPLGMAAHLRLVRMVHEAPPQLVLLGDSLMWKGQLRLAQGYDVMVANLGRPGDVVRDLRWRLEHGELDTGPSAAILMIGTNNLSRGHAPHHVAGEIEGLVGSLHRRHPDMRILLMGVPVAGASPTNPIRGKIKALNQRLKIIAAAHHLRYHDIGPLLIRPDGWLKTELFYDDHLHLKPHAYDLWADAIKDDMEALLAP